MACEESILLSWSRSLSWVALIPACNRVVTHWARVAPYARLVLCIAVFPNLYRPSSPAKPPIFVNYERVVIAQSSSQAFFKGDEEVRKPSKWRRTIRHRSSGMLTRCRLYRLKSDVDTRHRSPSFTFGPRVVSLYDIGMTTAPPPISRPNPRPRSRKIDNGYVYENHELRPINRMHLIAAGVLAPPSLLLASWRFRVVYRLLELDEPPPSQ